MTATKTPTKTPSKGASKGASKRQPSARRPTSAPSADVWPTASRQRDHGIVSLSHRLHERRRRSVARRRLVVVVIVVVVAAIAVGGLALLHSPWFSARTVEVSGVTGSQRQAVLQASGLDHHPPLLDVDPGAAGRAVEGLPWVDRAAVVRHWPDRVTVTVSVRQPVAAAKSPTSGWAEIDRTGRVLADLSTPPPGLVQVALAQPPGAAGSWLSGSARQEVKVAADLPPALRADVAQVSIGTGDQLQLQLTSPVTVVLGSAGRLHQKFEDAASILAATTLAPGEEVNVTVPDSPWVGSPTAA